MPINAGIRRPRSWAALPPDAPLLPGALLPGTGMLIEDDGGMEPRFVFDNGYGNKAVHLDLRSVHIVSPPLRDNWPYFQQVARRHALSGCGVDPENPESMRDIYYRGCSSVRGHFGRRRSRRRCKLPWFCCFGWPCERMSSSSRRPRARWRPGLAARQGQGQGQDSAAAAASNTAASRRCRPSASASRSTSPGCTPSATMRD